MAPKGSFENNFANYSEEAASHILNKTKDGISEKFEVKLRNFKTTKLQLLTTKMGSDIYHDSTVYTGSAGLALYYFMSSLGKNEVSHETLKNAIPYLDLENLKGRKISFLCGDAGPLALATVISYRLGSRKNELPDYKSLVQRLMALSSLLNDSPDEVLYGKSGYLFALLFVNKHIPGKEVIPSNHIEKVISSILKSGKQYSMLMKSESPLLWQWHEKIYFGGAHGIAGILYMLLQAQPYISMIELRSFIKPTLEWLINHKFPSGNFPSSLGSGSGDRLVQWCHGAPGFVPLCLLAHKVFDDDNYLRIALQCGEVIWERGLSTKGYSICHGVSGNAYAFIQLYQATKVEHYC
ncbi:glutathione S-transferase LANCL1-like isoform X3 [Choristoneura fumiferana]|uniref:glutathione S-transferase LANCL1-like isoform X3 n=1 Tax=Choristoneura fumiferana TaxID=7141 RepID=UPI003D15B610